MGKKLSGQAASVFVCNGASNHSDKDRAEYDYYATEPRALELLLEKEKFNNDVWECACGELHLSNVLERAGYNIRNSDIVDRLHNGKIEVLDFLNCDERWSGDIITNPPYKYATEFAKKALDIVEDGCRVAMFLKLTFLESESRRELFEKYPFETLYVSSSRLQCARNGNFKETGQTAMAYGWYIWRKGFKGKPIIKWFN